MRTRNRNLCRKITLSFFLACFSLSVLAQTSKLKNKKYPSLLWEITKKGMAKPSYLFGTMHVSSKMAFHLSDSFYLGIKNADVVALETNPGTWQEDFSKYNLEGGFGAWRNRDGEPSDFLSINTFRSLPYEKLLEAALSSQPSMINNFLYRNNRYGSADFEEDTYLDLYIYQVGRKWNKKLSGVEDFHQSMTLMKEAYVDAAKDKKSRQRRYDSDNEFSYAKLEEAYRTGNLDLLDTIHKVNSRSDAFDEKFLYRRNEIQAANIDSIIRTKASLFVGVGAAHLPGERGVIEQLRRMGYKLRPIKMTERDSRHKEEIETLRVPVQFGMQKAEDDLFSASLPGKLYSFVPTYGLMNQQQYADMGNGSYYMVTRVPTFAGLWSHDEKTVLRKLDSVLYENIPGKMMYKKAIVRNGFNGYDILNKTRRGDFQRYHVFVTPHEVLVFKMSGNGEYVKVGTETDQFFNSIQLKMPSGEWKKYTPPFGGFSVEMPEPYLSKHLDNWKFSGIDKATGTHYLLVRADIHNFDFVEEDSFDLALMEESFGASDQVHRQLSRQHTQVNGYAALDAKYRFKDSSTALVRFVIQGPHYYMLVANSRKEHPKMSAFLQSFAFKPFVYPEVKKQTDTALYYTVQSPVPLQKPAKLEMYPEEAYRYGMMNEDEEENLLETGTYKDRLIENDSTGEKIYVSFYKPGRYETVDTTVQKDTIRYKEGRFTWTYRNRKKTSLPNGTQVFAFESGDSLSSRMLQGKVFRKDGVSFFVRSYGDTLSQRSAFVQSFFDSFAPADTVKGVDRNKKSALFFSDFFSADTSLHKRAVKNIEQVDLDSTDFASLKRVIESLSWKERKYLDVKTSLIGRINEMPGREASDYLKQIYFAAEDTIDLQYAALNGLLNQQTAYSFAVFRDIMTNEPPVLNVQSSNSYSSVRNVRTTITVGVFDEDDDGEDRINAPSNFLGGLYDSLQLTQTIFKDLLPLINLNDYEAPMMNLLKVMVDSNLVSAKDYETYLPKFLLEAKQELKKQVIKEKAKSIEKAQQDEEDRERDYGMNEDYGNRRLMLYASLLMPFWDRNPSVQPVLKQLLQSSDKRLKYETTLLFGQYNKPLPDTLLSYFAALDEYRYELYMDLRRKEKLSLFPQAYNNHLALAKSELMSNSNNKEDTIVYIDRLPAQLKGKKGWVYFFRYRNKKEEGSWKLAMAGLVPQEGKEYLFSTKGRYEYDAGLDLTQLTNTKIDLDEPLQEQLQKALKKKIYAKRRSAASFYEGGERSPASYLFNLRD
jgi:uncharacterized protein YbaP (TraB family)